MDIAGNQKLPLSRNNNLYAWGLVALICLFFLLRLPFTTKEYAPEEAAWIRAGQGVEQTGFPWTYMGEQSKGSWAYWKGPMFPWLLGAGFKIFGEHEAVARSIPFMFSLGQIILIYFLSRRIFDGELGKKIGLLTAFLISINPLAIQNSVQVDIDGGLVGFFILLTLYFAWPIFSEPNPRKRRLSFLFFASAAAFLVRFDVSLMIFFSIVVYAITQKRYDLAKSLMFLFVLASIVAIVIFATYNSAFGQLRKTADPFRNIAGQLTGTLLGRLGLGNTLLQSPNLEGAPPSRLYDVLPGIKGKPFAPLAVALFPTAALLTVIFVWITLPLVALIIFFFIQLIRGGWFKEKSVLFLMLPALIILTAFIVVAPSFSYPRYIHSSLVLTLIPLSYFLIRSIGELGSPLSRELKMPFFTFILTFTLATLTPIKILLLDNRVRENPIRAGLALAVTALVSLLVSLAIRNKRQAVAISTCLLATYLAFSGIIIAKDLRKPYSLNAYYGNYGFKQAGDFLKSIAKTGDIVVTVDTVGYYYGKPYYDINGYDPKTIKADFIVPYRVPPSRFESLVEGENKIASFGTVEIYSVKK